MIHQKKDERQTDRIFPDVSVAEKSPRISSEVMEPFIEPAELTLLRQFFDLLAYWNEPQEGESKDE